MILENTRFGTIEVSDDKIVTMIRSMPGFPGRKRFILLNREESQPFLWYQSVDDPALAFVIINPYLLNPTYSADLKPAAIGEMAWGDHGMEDVAVFVIVNASIGAPEKMTANLMAPLVINTKRLEAIQVVLQDSVYSHMHPIFEKGSNGTQNQLEANSY